MSTKLTTEDVRSIDVRLWKRVRLLQPGRTFNTQWFFGEQPRGAANVEVEADRVILEYRYSTADQQWEMLHYPVDLVLAPCNLSG